jgi:hypothetical protein
MEKESMILFTRLVAYISESTADVHGQIKVKVVKSAYLKYTYIRQSCQLSHGGWLTTGITALGHLTSPTFQSR